MFQYKHSTRIEGVAWDTSEAAAKAGSQIDAKALRCVALNFASGENIEIFRSDA